MFYLNLFSFIKKCAFGKAQYFFPVNTFDDTTIVMENKKCSYVEIILINKFLEYIYETL